MRFLVIDPLFIKVIDVPGSEYPTAKVGDVITSGAHVGDGYMIRVMDDVPTDSRHGIDEHVHTVLFLNADTVMAVVWQQLCLWLEEASLAHSIELLCNLLGFEFDGRQVISTNAA